MDFTAKFETSKYADRQSADFSDQEEDSQQEFLQNLKSNREIEGKNTTQPQSREQLELTIVDLFTRLLVDANNKTGKSHYFYHYLYYYFYHFFFEYFLDYINLYLSISIIFSLIYSYIPSTKQLFQTNKPHKINHYSQYLISKSCQINIQILPQLTTRNHRHFPANPTPIPQPAQRSLSLPN